MTFHCRKHGFITQVEPCCAAALIQEEYQGWTNSATWSAQYLLEQERKVNDILSTKRLSGETITAMNCKRLFFASCLKLDSWVQGPVNWQEIANFWNDKEF